MSAVLRKPVLRQAMSRSLLITPGGANLRQQHQSARRSCQPVRSSDDGQLAQLSEFADRTMTLQATIQDGAIWLSDARNNLVNTANRLATALMIAISRTVSIADNELEIRLSARRARVVST